jgi:hypothetical protein
LPSTLDLPPASSRAIVRRREGTMGKKLTSKTTTKAKAAKANAAPARAKSTDASERPAEGMAKNYERVFAMKFAKVYPLYVQKAVGKNRTKEEVDQVIRWLTGYTQKGLQQQIEKETDFQTFFSQAPAMHPNCALIQGVVCGVRIEDIEDPLMRKIRYLDKLIDELAKGRAIEKILRQ